MPQPELKLIHIQRALRSPETVVCVTSSAELPNLTPFGHSILSIRAFGCSLH